MASRTDTKTYVGNGRKKSATWMKLSIDLDKAIAYAKVSDKNGKRYLNLDINVRNEPDQYGQDVAATIDDFVPKKNGANGVPPPPSAFNKSAASAPSSAGIDINDDLPF